MENVIVNDNYVNIEDKEMQEFSELSFWDKTKLAFEKVMDSIKVLRMICSFTSLLALINVMFFFASQINLNDFWAGVIAFLGAVGIISGLIACPLKLILTAAAIIGKAVVIGLVFPIPGIFIGLAIGLIIAFLLIFIAPAIVTIPNCLNEL